jgi:hypothetical protein
MHVLLPFPDLVNGGGAVALHRFVLDPVVAMCGGRVFVVPVWS